LRFVVSLRRASLVDLCEQEMRGALWIAAMQAVDIY